jgi:hypothetical protein
VIVGAVVVVGAVSVVSVLASIWSGAQSLTRTIRVPLYGAVFSGRPLSP